MRKIQAFTLGELLVVMVISSIIVTVSFMALGNIQRQVKSVNETFERQQKILALERILTSDLHSHEAQYLGESKTMVFENSFERIQYRILPNKIARNTDTLQISIGQVQLYLEGQKVSAGRFDAIEFSFSDTFDQQGFFVYKRNDGAHYINE